jgi:hypothetical protein
MPITGTLQLSGIDDANLVTILQVKEQYPILTFSPQQMQTAAVPGQVPKQIYNNVLIGWGQGDGLAALKELLNRLTAK